MNSWMLVNAGRVPLMKLTRAIVLILCLFGLTCCAEEDNEILNRGKQLAERFHKTTMKTNVDELSSMVDYPFNFDNRHRLESEEDFKKFIGKKLREMQRRMSSARKIECLTYDQFLRGEKIRGVSLTREQAESESKKIGLKEGGVLVRCYAVGKDDGEQDGRDYFLVLQKDSLGDLKVITYYD